jgi:hypothetical protein
MSLLKLMSACRAGGVVISSVATEKITPEFIAHLVSGDCNRNMIKENPLLFTKKKNYRSMMGTNPKQHARQ